MEEKEPSRRLLSPSTAARQEGLLSNLLSWKSLVMFLSTQQCGGVRLDFLLPQGGQGRWGGGTKQ